MREVLGRVSAAEAIVNHFREAIAAGELAPGEKLPSERQLQKSLGVSRLALREGMARLSALGLIRVHHGKGAFVQDSVSPVAMRDVLVPLFPAQNPKHLQDLIEARSMVEGEIAARAAERRTERDLDLLEELLLHDPQVLRDAELFAERDFAFHQALAKIANNAFLSLMLEAMAPHVRSFLNEFSKSLKQRQEALERHRPVLEAIREEDPDKARELARGHMAVCARALRQKGK